MKTKRYQVHIAWKKGSVTKTVEPAADQREAERVLEGYTRDTSFNRENVQGAWIEETYVDEDAPSEEGEAPTA